MRERSNDYKDQVQLEAENVAWRDWSGEQPGMSAFAREGEGWTSL